MKKINKWLYGWKISINYGAGFEYELFETDIKEARARVREYRANCPQYAVRMARGRELNPDYVAPICADCRNSIAGAYFTAKDNARFCRACFPAE